MAPFLAFVANSHSVAFPNCTFLPILKHYGILWIYVAHLHCSLWTFLTVNCRASDRQSDTYAQNFGAEAGSYRPFRLALLVSYAFDHLDTS